MIEAITGMSGLDLFIRALLFFIICIVLYKYINPGD